MYKRHSPEALSLTSLGRADSKRPDSTCRGITTAGRPCRKPIKKGSKEKYCHLHRDQQSTARSRLLGAKTRTVDEEFEVGNDNSSPSTGYPTPLPSPSPLRPSSGRKPLPSISFPLTQHARLPSLQLSPPPSIAPLTPAPSIHSTPPHSAEQHQRKKNFNLVKRIQKIFLRKTNKANDSNSTRHHPLVETALQGGDASPSRQPQITPPSDFPSSNSLSPSGSSPNPVHEPKAPNNSTTKSNRSNVPPLQGRPPTEMLLLAQSRTATTGVKRSWETMWVPGIDGLGAHIICKGTR